MPDDEVLVHPRTPMPPGYTFVPKGNVYVTAHCRRKTHAQGRTVYVVSSKADANKVLGLRCPTTVVETVRAAEQATRAARHDATAKRDAAVAATFREALLTRYPAVPADTVPQIVQHALTKHARRVARTSTLDEAARVRLAVRAHIRHRRTDYEAILRQSAVGTAKGKKTKGKGKGQGKGQGKGRRDGKLQRLRRAEARALTVGRVNAIEREWSGKSGQSGQSGTGSIEGEEGSIEDESSGSAGSADSEEGEEADEDEEEGVERQDHKTVKGRDRRSGKGASITARRKEGDTAARQASKAGKDNKAAGNDRVQKTAPTTTLRKARSSKSQATVRIARCQQPLSLAGGDKKETAIVIDSDSDWIP